MENVRVEGGGILNALLRGDQACGIWRPVHPVVPGSGVGKALRPEIIGRVLEMKLRSSRRMKGGAVLLKYEVSGAPPP